MRVCEFHGCTIKPYFGIKNSKKASRCYTHRLYGYENVKDRKCESENCIIRAYFGYTGGRAERCSTHRLDGQINVKDKLCDCGKKPYFGLPGERPNKCFSHKLENFVDVRSKRCQHASCNVYEKYERNRALYVNPSTGKKDLCLHCHRGLFPGKHLNASVRKEHILLAEIQNRFPNLNKYFVSWDCPLSCTLKRADMLWKISETLFHIEIDEEGNSHEDNLERLVEIHAASNMRFHCVVRFNPDEYTRGEIKYKPCLRKIRTSQGENIFTTNRKEWERRIPIVMDHLENIIENLEKGEDESVSGKTKICFND